MRPLRRISSAPNGHQVRELDRAARPEQFTKIVRHVVNTTRWPPVAELKNSATSNRDTYRLVFPNPSPLASITSTTLARPGLSLVLIGARCLRKTQAVEPLR